MCDNFTRLKTETIKYETALRELDGVAAYNREEPLPGDLERLSKHNDELRARVSDLEVQRRGIQQTCVELGDSVKDAKAKLGRAREALKYYAHPDHYEPRETLSGTRQPGVLTEKGDKARKALAEIGEKL